MTPPTAFAGFLLFACFFTQRAAFAERLELQDDDDKSKVEVAAENRDFVAKYFAQHGYERLTKYEAYDSVNQYYARRGGT